MSFSYPMYKGKNNSPKTTTIGALDGGSTPTTVFVVADASVLYPDEYNYPEQYPSFQSFPNYATLGSGDNAEVIQITNISANTVTCVRGQGLTSVRTWPAGTEVYRAFTKADHNALIDNLNDMDNRCPTNTDAHRFLHHDGTNYEWSQVDLATNDVTGSLPVGKGGTNATTAADARTNLGLGSMSLLDDVTTDGLWGRLQSTTGGVTSKSWVQAAAKTTSKKTYSVTGGADSAHASSILETLANSLGTDETVTIEIKDGYYTKLDFSGKNVNLNITGDPVIVGDFLMTSLLSSITFASGKSITVQGLTVFTSCVIAVSGARGVSSANYGKWTTKRLWLESTFFSSINAHYDFYTTASEAYCIMVQGAYAAFLGATLTCQTASTVSGLYGVRFRGGIFISSQEVTGLTDAYKFYMESYGGMYKIGLLTPLWTNRS